MSKPLIGILAGMGPRSTAPFVDLVVDQCQVQYGALYDIDFPQMIILSQPTPFYLDRPIRHDELRLSILEGIYKLEACGASFIAMPCNSAHLYFDELQTEARVPLLNIVEETLLRLPKASRVALFATKPTIDSGVYQSGLQRAGRELIVDCEWQTTITSIIGNIKNGKLDRAARDWLEVVSKVREAGVEAIVSACTDLNVVIKGATIDLPLIDSARALAEATVARYLSLR
jgi:aspartate racemase